MKTEIRQEEPKDYKTVSKIIETAFIGDPYSDNREHILVEKLRLAKGFVPELSLVAMVNDELVGHILLTPIKIKNEYESIMSLALAPVSVKVGMQGQGVGGKLINVAHKKAKALGYKHVVLLGHENYYPRFGYELTSKYNIKLPFDAPEENCMVIALEENALDGVYGIVEYPKEFLE